MNQLALDLQPATPEYRKIPLTQGQFALVDAADYDWLNQWKWMATLSCSNTYYAVRSTADSTGVKKQRTVSMSRMIMGYPAGKFVDHKNHNTLDNRRCNLRIADKFQNGYNRKKNVNNTSGYKGVYKNPRGGWMARIKARNETVYLGTFKTPEIAHQAYVAAAQLRHGEFADW